MDVKRVARRLSYEQRELLILHVQAPQPIVHLVGSAKENKQRILTALVSKRFVTLDRGMAPKISTITELGREAAAVVLGDLADMMIRFGRLDELRPTKALPEDVDEFRLLAASAAALTDH